MRESVHAVTVAWNGGEASAEVTISGRHYPQTTESPEEWPDADVGQVTWRRDDEAATLDHVPEALESKLAEAALMAWDEARWDVSDR